MDSSKAWHIPKRQARAQKKNLLPIMADRKSTQDLQLISSNSLTWLCFKRRTQISEVEKDWENIISSSVAEGLALSSAQWYTHLQNHMWCRNKQVKAWSLVLHNYFLKENKIEIYFYGPLIDALWTLVDKHSWVIINKSGFLLIKCSEVPGGKNSKIYCQKNGRQQLTSSFPEK